MTEYIATYRRELPKRVLKTEREIRDEFRRACGSAGGKFSTNNVGELVCTIKGIEITVNPKWKELSAIWDGRIHVNFPVEILDIRVKKGWFRIEGSPFDVDVDGGGFIEIH